MNCANCAAPMDLIADRGYFVCDHCGSFHFPRENDDGVRALGKKSRMACPVCRERLQAGHIEDKSVLHCGNCQGILASQRAFTKIIEMRRAKRSGPPHPPKLVETTARERELDCPRCKERMHVHPYYGPGHVWIDTCISCTLVWLDRGEISTIVVAP